MTNELSSQSVCENSFSEPRPSGSGAASSTKRFLTGAAQFCAGRSHTHILSNERNGTTDHCFAERAACVAGHIARWIPAA